MTKPSVKKLEWQDCGSLGYAATFEGLHYTARRRRNGLFDLFFGPTDDETMKVGITQQEAMSLGQADFERRILSALEGGDDG